MMRASLRVLVISGALAIALATQGSLAKDSDATAAAAAADVRKALSEIKTSWRNYDPCDREKRCDVYFETFGVGLTFNDGTIAPFTHTQRLKASRHDCIVNARDALARGDKSMAVQWVMASRLESPVALDWLGEHPDAIIEALQHCCI
jgi:hypothetical protein